MKPKTSLGLLVKIGGIIIVAAGGFLPFAAKAVSFDELYWSQPKWQVGQVLGQSAYPPKYLVKNSTLKLFITPLSFDSSQACWNYQINWSRTKKAPGSLAIKLKGQPVSLGEEGMFQANANQLGSKETGCGLTPNTRYSVEFYSKPQGQGKLLARKYFKTLKAADEPAPMVCSMEAKLCPDKKTYVSRQGPNCEFAACPQKLQQASVKLLSPNGGEKWKIGSTQTIKWSLSSAASSGYFLELKLVNASDSSVESHLKLVKPSLGQYQWKIDQAIQGDVGINIEPGKYKLRAVLYDGMPCLGLCTSANAQPNIISKDESDGSFTLSADLPPTDVPPVTTPVDEPVGIGKFRYMRIDTAEQGWVSWREIEAYDIAGKKVEPATITSSANWPYPAHGAIGTSGVTDGNISTVWNAGETACPNQVCPSATRSAWIELDFGGVKTFSKIRLMENGSTQTEVTKVLVGETAATKQIAEFRAPIRDNEWLEYPYNTSRPAPTASLTVNGKKDVTINPGQDSNTGEGLLFEWKAENADQAVFASEFHILAGGAGCQPRNLLADLANSASYSAGNFGLQLEGCSKGKTYQITYTAKQRGTDKTASETVTVRVGNKTANYNGPAYYIGLGTRPTILRGQTGSINVGVTRAGGALLYPMPSIKAINLPSGITVVLEQFQPRGLPSNPNEIMHATLKITVASTAAPGHYFLRLVGNEGQQDSLFTDVHFIVE